MHNIRYKMFLFFSMLLLCSFFRLKELFQVKNGLTTSFHRLLFYLFENAKNLGRSYDGERRKKRGWPNANLLYRDFLTYIFFFLLKRVIKIIKFRVLS